MGYIKIQAGFHAKNFTFSQDDNYLRVSDSVDLLSRHRSCQAWSRPGRQLLLSVSPPLFARTPAAPQNATLVAHAGKGGDAAMNHRTINRHPRPQPRQLPSHCFSPSSPGDSLRSRKSSPSSRLATPCVSSLRLIAHGLFRPPAAAAPSSRLNSRRCSRPPPARPPAALVFSRRRANGKTIPSRCVRLRIFG